ncbi:hypothetical protein ACFWPP_09140 [Streptomyces anulatus]|uniref:hypothetical protein n=1 Tax=Streptomyces anulatus TaxID=1892 RepID=UPI0036564390
MPDVWENTRSRWESVRHAVDGGVPGVGAAATALHGRLGLSVNPIAVTGEAAVSQCDPYGDRPDEARGHYIPGRARRESPFAALTRDLENETLLRLSVLPMASRLIRHQYLPGLPVGTSQLDDAQIGALRTHFGQEIQTFITQRNGG